MKHLSMHKILNYFLNRIILGFFVIGGSVVLIELALRYLLNIFQIPDEINNFLVASVVSGISLYLYIILYSWLEQRQITELSISEFGKNSLAGFASGFFLQSVFILFIFITCTYSIESINSVTILLPSFSTALTAGFVGEIIFRGILFRIAEEKFGTITALSFITLLFAIFHLNAEGATPVSVLSTAMVAGLLLSSVYVLTRSLWVPIFLHFGWDFAEPGIYGAINPGNSIQQSLFSSHIAGPDLLTGGQLGPQNSIQALITSMAVCIIVLWLVSKKAIEKKRKKAD